MNPWLESVAIMLGREPRRPTPEEISPAAQEVHQLRRTKLDHAEVVHIKDTHHAKSEKPKKWRRRRWAVLIAVNSLFVMSFWLTVRFDVQILEGALTGSRFVGFHMADVNSSLQVMLASRMVKINLVIGIVTVFMLWWMLGGRTFCSWVCPYHLLAEWAEILHLKLVAKGWVKDHPLDRRARVWFWLVFAGLALVTGYTVYETISPTGIVSRALIYGTSGGLVWVVALLLFEIFYSRRAWCRYVCPIGLTYGVVGSTSPLKVTYNVEGCLHEGKCRSVCMVPHVLNPIIKGRARDVKVNIGPDCTRCGRCVETCPTDSLTFNFKLGGS